MVEDAARRLYTHGDLVAVVRPRSVAVVGASGGSDGVGDRALRNLLRSGPIERIYAVHPRLGGSADLPPGVIGVTSLRDIGVPVDLVLVAVQASRVPGVVADAADLGCASCVIFAAGFGEAGGLPELEDELRRIAGNAGMLLGGPNTAGLVNFRDRLALTFVPEIDLDAPPGNLGIVSQSTGLAMQFVHRRHRGAGLSYALTVGNGADITALDYVNFLLDDERTDVVLLALEGAPDLEQLRWIGRRARVVGKPVLILKTGRTPPGRQAVAAHTGNRAGDHEIFLVAAAQAGLPVFRHPEEALEAALLFAKWSGIRPTSAGAAVLTTMGGGGVIAADAAYDHGVVLPAPGPATAAGLAKLMPSFAGGSNPVDTTAYPSNDALMRILELLAADEQVAAVVLLLAGTTGGATAQRPQLVARLAERVAAPIAVVWMSSWLEGPGSDVVDGSTEVPVFRSSDRCFRALRAWLDWHSPAGEGTRNVAE